MYGVNNQKLTFTLIFSLTAQQSGSDSTSDNVTSVTITIIPVDCRVAVTFTPS